jgi:predicted  nucleic acid-binding Zn-ribbon protein
MLLNVVQQQNATMKAQAEDLAAVKAESHAASLQLEAVQLALAKFIEANRQMQAELSRIKLRDGRVAMRE